MSKKLSVVEGGAVVAIYYTLEKGDGTVVDTNRRGGKPLVFLQGLGHVVKGLDAGVLGRKRDEYFELDLPPADAFGERSEAAIQKVPRSSFPEKAPLEPGARFIARDDMGHNVPTLVLAVEDDVVTVDHNHPLAGETLHFEVTVVGIRAATEEEKTHGHVHGPGGHQH